MHGRGTFGGRWKRISAASAVVLMALAIVPSALASTIGGNFDASVITYTAAPGEVNNLTVTWHGSWAGAGKKVTIEDSGATISAGAHCTSVSAHKVECDASGGSLSDFMFEALLADGNDIANFGEDCVLSLSSCGGLVPYSDVQGGEGNDDIDGWLFGTIEGGPGDDFVATAGHGAVFGDAGNDTVVGNAGGGGSEGAALFGGEGNDVLWGDGTTILTVQDDDLLDGGPGSDILHGGGDLLHPDQDIAVYADRQAPVAASLDGVQNDGESGEQDWIRDDVEGIVGGDAPDSLFGSSGDDRLDGGGGGDTIFAFGGADQVWGGSGNDSLRGGSDDDVVSGDGNVPINSLRLADSGSPGEDTLHGEGGNDTLNGNLGDDRLFGDADNDFLQGDEEDDLLQGGSGTDDLDGGAGADMADYTDKFVGVTASLDGVANDGTPGENDFIRTSVEGLRGTDFLDNLTGGAGPDRLEGRGNPDNLLGEGGDDVIVDGLGGSADKGDNVNGGPGNDTADYSRHVSNVSLTLDGVANDGNVNVAEGDALTGIENLIGGSAHDTLVGDGRPNVLEGGPGQDVLVDGGGPGDVLSGGLDNDTADYSGRASSLVISLDDVANDAGEGDNVGTDVEGIIGGSGADVLVGNAAANMLDGNGGNDQLNGGLGNDMLFGDAGIDAVLYDGRAANVAVDLALGTGGAAGESDLLLNTIENARGGDGNDTLLGDGGANRLDGGPGNDVLDGRLGGDVLDGSAGVDTITYASRSNPVSVTFDGVGNDGEAGEGDNVDPAAVGIENIVGGSSDDALSGNALANEIDGGPGDDTMRGAGADDILRGGTSSTGDTLFGEDGNDTLQTGAGDDVLAGGDGNDTLASQDGADALNGESGDDLLLGGPNADGLRGGPGTDTVDYTGHDPAPCSGICPIGQRGPGVEVSLDDLDNDGNLGFDSPFGGTVLNPLPAGDNVHSDVEVVVGTAGPDTLADVETGARLRGMGGNDRLVDGRGANIFEGGAGTDTVDYSGGEVQVRSISIDGVANDGVAERSGVSLENDNVMADVENVVAGPGDDSIVGSAAANRLTGGPGIDSFQAGSGDDFIASRDSIAESEFDCGPGSDTVEADALDVIDDRAALECELVLRPDSTPPVITAAVSGTLGSNGWYTSNVSVTWTVADAESAISSSTGCGLTIISSDTLGTTLTCSATSEGGSASNSVTVKRDATAPTNVQTTLAREPDANGWYTAAVGWTTSGEDATSGIASCESGTYSGPDGADVTVSGRCRDNAGNYSAADASVPFDYDATRPSISGSASPAPNANGWNRTSVTVSFSCADGGSGIASCEPATTLENEGANQSVSGSALDNAGWTATATVSGINIDKTAPTLVLTGGPVDGATYYFGFVPGAPSCNASDNLSGVDGSCEVSGYSSLTGTHTLTASAKDKAGNEATATRTYTVLPWTLLGFYQPVDMNGVLNIVKSGVTVPLRFEAFAGSVELTDTADVRSLTATIITCDSSAGADAIEVTVTGATGLRYDTTSGQFVYNWHTPKKPGNCYRVTVTTQDGSSLAALFKLK